MDSVRDRLLELLGMEPLILLSLLALLAFAFYKIFLRNLIMDRHKTLNRIFNEILASYVMFLLFWFTQFYLQRETSELSRFFIYAGIAAVVSGAVFFVRTVKVIVFEYLFFNSMKVGVPVLLVNLVTLLFSIFIAAWLSTSVFGVRWAPLLATSAIVSVVLGLALQDTLGNLFAGVALQFDKPYEIGDWIEVHSERNTFSGEVHEITWRATILYGFYDEVITLPNRVAAQSEISNFSARAKPIYRAATIYMDVNAPEEEVKSVFTDVLKSAKGVIQDQEHFVMLRDLSEKGAQWRLFYPVGSYSKQFIILDDILMKAQSEFKKRGIQVARLRGDVQKSEDTST
jgi:small-conductance mechanosensitive channel